jgi:ABC-type Fe3+-hydroxamate transport system substrate-binding protein
MYDQLNREIILKNTPRRIVSLVPSQTELLVDLGLEDAVVGVTKFCVHPTHLRTIKTIVGGTKQINLEKLKALKPDIILCNKEENTKDIVEQCETIATTHISDIYTIMDSIALTEQYGKMFDCEYEATKICNLIKKNLKDFRVFISEKPTLKVAYFIWKNPWMAAANHTFINHLLKLNTFDNIFCELERYPEIKLEEVNSKIDVILLSSEPYPFKEKYIQEVQNVTQCSNVYLVDGEYFSWYGSRLIGAFNYFKTLRAEI